jgi:hypothetical protein
MSEEVADRARVVRNRVMMASAIAGEQDKFGDRWSEEVSLRAMLAFADESLSRASDHPDLREAAIKAALCLSGFAGEGISVDGFEEPETAYGLLVGALGMPDADDDDLRSALGSVQ